LKQSVANIQKIVALNLCSGCGGCVNVCENINFIEGLEHNYPVVENCRGCQKCLQVCPGAQLLKRMETNSSFRLGEKTPDSYVAFGNDPDIRKRGASGAVVTSLLIFLLSNKIIDGAICIKRKAGHPLQNEVIIARNRDDLLECMGSRYSPASVCAGLKRSLLPNERYAMVGKPCEINAVTNLQNDYRMFNQIIIKLALMCAGTPERSGTRELIEKGFTMKVAEVVSLEYRGNGWPGWMVVSNREGKVMTLPYLEGWNKYLCHTCNTRCRLCDDSFGSFADITCGDAWGKEYLKKSHSGGFSSVLINSENGKNCFDAAIKQGLITAEKIALENLLCFQKYLLDKNHNILERLAYLIAIGKKVKIKKIFEVGKLNPTSYLKLIYKVTKYQRTEKTQ
jgi:coenzyme F420 hydrogenase subunit beta